MTEEPLGDTRTAGADDHSSALVAGPVTKTYVTSPVLHSAVLSLRFGEVHALLGGNGSGKSTLIKILAGVVPADPGSDIVIGSITTSLDKWSPSVARASHLRFIHQDLGLVPDLTVAENLFIEDRFTAGRGRLISWARMRRDAAKVLERFGLDLSPNDVVGDLTLVQQTLIAAARALYDVAPGDRAIVVLDEPTAALPSREADQLMAAIRRYADDGHAILVVTHRLGEVVNVCDRITVLRQGHVVHEGLLAGQSESDLGKLITGVDAQTEVRGDNIVAIEPDEKHDGLSLHDISTDSLSHISLDVRPGEVVGLVDAGGQAGPQILRTIFGLERLRDGHISLRGSRMRLRNPGRAMARGIAYLPGQRLQDALFPGLSVGTNISIASLPAHRRFGLVAGSRERQANVAAVRDFHVSPTDADAEITSLSGGNQQKVSVARWMVRKPTCLLLEEPTQGVDVGARAEIWTLIGQAVHDGAAALVVSSDFQELATHCHRVLVYARGRHVRTLQGADLTVLSIAEVVQHA